jgi:hypothetical protein
MALYMVDVDPGASRAANPILRGLLRIIATIGRLRGKRPVVPDSPESVPTS